MNKVNHEHIFIPNYLSLTLSSDTEQGVLTEDLTVKWQKVRTTHKIGQLMSGKMDRDDLQGLDDL